MRADDSIDVKRAPCCFRLLGTDCACLIEYSVKQTVSLLCLFNSERTIFICEPRTLATKNSQHTAVRSLLHVGMPLSVGRNV